MMRSGARGVVVPAVCVAVVVAVWVVLLAGTAVAKPTSGEKEPHRFGLEPGSAHFSLSTLQAGAHPDTTLSFNLNHTPTEEEETYGDLKTVVVQTPPGFIGSSVAVPTCMDTQLINHECSPESQIGVVHWTFTGDSNRFPIHFTTPLYSMVANHGVAATVGYIFSGLVSQFINFTVRPDDLSLTATSPSLEGTGENHAISITFWGVPGSSVHNAERGLESEEQTYTGKPVIDIQHPGGEEVHDQVKPYVGAPTSCTGAPLSMSLSVNSWEEPESWSEAPVEFGPLTGCERVPFSPSFEALPTTTSAESPTGLDASVLVSQTWNDPETLEASDLQDSVVTLPEGVTINPSAGAGLGACSPEQYAQETSEYVPGQGCPPESKIGTIEIETPLLAENLQGGVYVATPYDNPFDSLLALYVVARSPERGVLVKVAGKLELNPITGQITTRFENTPQAPFNRFTLKFRPGAVAPLVSPPTCGSYSAQAAFTPWSAPLEPRSVSSTPFTITQGVREGPCPSGGVPPFKPQIVSGTQNNAAGSYSPFYLRIVRQDGEQEITKFTTVFPSGLTGNLTGVEKCPDADVEAARSASGAQEEAHPSCPAGSEIGHTIVEAGVGSVLAQTPGRLYLAGPYHGAPLSVVSITSAKVGPFDLGTVVIRFALDINPITAQVEISGAQSDPIPHILDGIVVHVRDIHTYVSRPDFTLNPTSCAPMMVQEAITGAGANPADPADQETVPAAAHFQAADCSNLAFKPSFTVSASGHTSRKDGASLHVDLSYPKAPFGSQANIASVKVDLPKQLPSRLSTLQKACTAEQFQANPAGCPAASIVGHAKAITPLIPVPLEGPAYFVSYGGAKFPELVVVLQGYGLTIDLHGETFISKAGITSSTFHTVPDQPVGNFELTLPEGNDSALAANGNLCKSKLVMPTAFKAQNGVEIHQSTPIHVTGCPKVKKRGKAARHSKHKRK